MDMVEQDIKTEGAAVQCLPKESELELAGCIRSTEWGRTASAEDVCHVVSMYVKENKGKNNAVGWHLEKHCTFPDDKPDLAWLEDYLQRYGLSIQEEGKGEVVKESAADSESEKTPRSAAKRRKLNNSKSEPSPAAAEVKAETPKVEKTQEKPKPAVSAKKDTEGFQTYSFCEKVYGRIQRCIKVDKFYAVYYGSGVHYIGYVTEVKPDTISMKFLHKKTHSKLYFWPGKEDIDESIDPKYVFCGPIALEGDGPYKVLGLNEATKAYVNFLESR